MRWVAVAPAVLRCTRFFIYSSQIPCQACPMQSLQYGTSSSGEDVVLSTKQNMKR